MKIERFDSSDTNVAKYVFTWLDAVAEAVLYKYGDYETRTVICCSTQSGCSVGCSFCGTGKNFVRSLTANEIVDQVDYLINDRKIDTARVKSFQIMFMSMGEPMLNYKSLELAIKYLHAAYPNAKLLISTSGPAVDYGPLLHLATQIDSIGLQFSVHESTDAARDKLIPFKHKLLLGEISEVGENFYALTGRQPFFNYCVHEKNNTDQDVGNLYRTFDPSVWQATLSVICEADETVASSIDRQAQLADEFSQKLLECGFNTRVFNPAGQDDISGGCGQLWHTQRWMKAHPDLVHINRY